ncbi:MAG: sugar ABC transporter permease [Actinomycetaceae bacterium]|nr:sugar ABC transporter permease [Actinomycetaceae bacterium]
MANSKGISQSGKAQRRLAALLVSPTLIIIAIVILFPTISALYQSFWGVAGIDPETGFVNESEPFVGAKNYVDIFVGDTGTRFWNAFWNTTFFAAVTVFIETILGVAMALIMHQALKARGLVRAAILVPWAIPTAVSAVLWGWIFNAHGAANAILGTQILWATSNWPAKCAIVIADTWKTAPFIGLLTLAGLQVIPDDVYEAAKIDGASAWRRFTTITLPLVKPALVVAVLFRMLDALRMFDLPYILIGPRKSQVETLSMLVQDEASNLRYGSASAYAVILFIYVFLIAFAFIRLLGAELVDEPATRGSRLRLSQFFKRPQKPQTVPANDPVLTKYEGERHSNSPTTVLGKTGTPRNRETGGKA